MQLALRGVAFRISILEIEKNLKKVLTIMYHYDIIYLVADTQQQLNKCGEVSKWS